MVSNSISTFSAPYYECIHFPEIGSTHTWVLESPDILVEEYHLSSTRPVRVSADYQTKGRGQRRDSGWMDEHTTWVSSSGNVLVTFVHPWLKQKIAQAAQLPQVASIAVVNVLKQLGLDPKVKWVNDILVNKKKICGILCELPNWPRELPKGEANKKNENDVFTAVVVSIGLNVLTTPSLATDAQPVTCIKTELEAQDDAPPTGICSSLTIRSDDPHTLASSLHPEGLRTANSRIAGLTPLSVLNSLSGELYQIIKLYEQDGCGFSPIQKALTPILYGIGQIVTVDNPDVHSSTRSLPDKPTELIGELIGVSSESGFLVLKLLNTGNILEIQKGHLSVR